MKESKNITSVLNESRTFAPLAEFTQNAHINSTEMYESMWLEAKDEPNKFWSKKANELLDWDRGFDEVLNWNPPFAKWFEGGKINASYNCLDRHVKNGLGEKTAIFWEGEPGDKRKLSFRELF